MKKGDYLKGGFTIIEVVLVLAVAGLIFAMAFIAVPSLQRSQRDNDRRDDMLTFVSEVKRYQTSNRGNLPGSGDTLPKQVVWSSDWETTKPAANTWAGFYNSYLGKMFIDPDGTNYRLSIVDCNAKRVDANCEGGALTAINALKASTFSNNNHTMLVVARGKCVGDNIVGSSSPRNLAVMYHLEGSGVYCYGT